MERHPERPERLIAVLNRLKEAGVTQDMDERKAKEISIEQLQMAHPVSYIQSILDSEPVGKVIKVDQDTYMSEGSGRAAKLAAGAVAEATSLVLAGQTNKVFCAIRPPGHHAEMAESSGFCMFNNVAIGAYTALQNPEIERVAILDFDVHHCNGTVDIFKDDPRVLVCSSFQDNLFPDKYLDFTNEHIVNTPLIEGTIGLDYRKRIEAEWLTRIQAHKPDLIFISAGFDAHKDDPLASICLDEDDYRWITSMFVDLANSYSKGRIISVLEGGYDLNALSNAALAHVETLIGKG